MVAVLGAINAVFGSRRLTRPLRTWTFKRQERHWAATGNPPLNVERAYASWREYQADRQRLAELGYEVVDETRDATAADLRLDPMGRAARPPGGWPVATVVYQLKSGGWG